MLESENNKKKYNIYKIIGTQWFFLLMVVLLISIITTSINPRFASINNIKNILEQISVLGLVAAGATILIISGNFDISAGAMLGLSSCIMAILINKGFNSIFVIIIGILVCILCSLLNGILSIVLNAPSFIISLATTGVFTGIALSLTNGVIQTIYGKFDTVGSIKIFNVIPLIFIISIVGYLLVHFILKYTQIGRRLFAIGTNEKSAYLAGIKIKANKLLFFGLNGFFIGIASVVLLSRLGAALPSTGAGMELQAIGAVVIGGVPINGGKGNVIGTFVGVLLMGLIANVLNILRVNPYLQEIAFGSLIIISIALSAIRVKMNLGKKN